MIAPESISAVRPVSGLTAHPEHSVVPALHANSTFDEALNTADQRLYANKRLGRTRR